MLPSVSSSTPKVVLLRTWLPDRIDPNLPWLSPPVPTTNSRMPFALSGAPDGFWGANRS